MSLRFVDVVLATVCTMSGPAAMGADPLASGLRAGPPLRAPDFAADSTDSSKFASGTLLDTALTLGASVNPGESPTGSAKVITWYLSDDPTVGVNTANTPLARELIQGQVAVPSGPDEQSCSELTVSLSGNNRYWNVEAGSHGVSQLADSNVIAGAERAGASELQLTGTVSARCLQGAEPFYESSPLASRSFWTPVLIVAFGIAALLVTRGWRLPA